MTDTKQQRENDALQSSEDDLAYGQDPRTFGAGRQDELTHPSSANYQSRDVERDRSLDPAHESARSDRTTRGTYHQPDTRKDQRDEGDAAERNET